MCFLADHCLSMAGDGLITTLHGLGVRCVEDLKYLCKEDVVTRLKLPLVDERKFLCMLAGTAGVWGNKTTSRLSGDEFFQIESRSVCDNNDIC
jgi:hypothetical protein